MGGSILNREDYKTAIPQLSSQLNDLLQNNVIINRTVITLSEGKVSDLNTYLGYFQNLATGYFQAIAGDIEYLSSREAYINHLKTDIASFGYLTAETADLRYATISNLNAAVARIGDLEADHVSVTDLAATNADVAHLKVGDLTIGGVTVNIYDLAVAIKNSAMASGTTWYKVSASTPTAPAVFDPTADGWSQTEPAYIGGTTDHLYSCLRVVYADDDPLGTRHFQWSDVHMIQSWEAAKSAYSYAGVAKTAANTAVSNLSQVQEVLEVVEWVAKHGTYTKATTFNPNATYYTVTATEVTEPSNADVDSHGVLIYYEEDDGIYVRTEDQTVDDQKTYYRVTGTPVSEPKQEHLSQYYTLAVTEAMADYIQSHLMLTNDGLYVMKDGSGYKLRLTDYGSYIIAPDGTTIVNQNTADGNILRALDGTVIAHLGYGEGQSESGTAEAPYFTFGKRRENSIIGNYSVAEGTGATASGAFSHAEGNECTASGSRAHAEGNETTASNSASHAEGNHTIASGEQSHAAGNETIAAYESQTAIGAYNDNQNNTAFEIGNGTDEEHRSNAFTVGWDGNVKAQGWAGFVQMFAGATAPNGWLFCDGSEVAIAKFQTLYSVIGTTYNDGTETSGYFRLPDLKNRFPVGVGSDYALNDTGGSEYIQEHSHSFTQPTVDNGGGTNNITGGSHNHEIKYSNVTRGSGGTSTRTGPYSYTNTKYDGVYNKPNNHTHNLPNHTHRVQNGAVNAVKDVTAGNGGNLPPYIGINFIICTGETS